MNSSQINFYMMPDDVAELEQYLQQNGWVILAYRFPTATPVIVTSLQQTETRSCYLALATQIPLVKTRYSEPQQCYFIEEINSPVIQYAKSVVLPEKNTFHRGRVYYNKLMSNNENTHLVDKNEEFLQKAAKLFSWYKRHFPNVKINGSWTTPRAAEILKVQLIAA